MELKGTRYIDIVGTRDEWHVGDQRHRRLACDLSHLLLVKREKEYTDKEFIVLFHMCSLSVESSKLSIHDYPVLMFLKANEWNRLDAGEEEHLPYQCTTDCMDLSVTRSAKEFS